LDIQITGRKARRLILVKINISDNFYLIPSLRQ